MLRFTYTYIERFPNHSQLSVEKIGQGKNIIAKRNAHILQTENGGES